MMEQSNSKGVFLDVLKKIGITLIILIAGILILAVSIFNIICHGPSESARDLFVTTCMETSFAKYFPMMVLSKEEIKAIRDSNAVIDTKETTNENLVSTDENAQNIKQPDIEIVDVKENNFKGYMAIIKDPSRVKVATIPSFGHNGMQLIDLIKSENAVLGVNGGAFEDNGGVGKGGTPLGVVIKDGKLLTHSYTDECCVIGFDKNNVLHVGNMTGDQAMSKGIRDAVAFGPVLVVNGKPASISGNGGGLNPRTAIGQRADGSVLILVIDGRQPHSAGASHKDLVEIMVEFDAVNAANLDGGSSTMMYYNGEIVNSCASIYGTRNIPTAFVVV